MNCVYSLRVMIFKLKVSFFLHLHTHAHTQRIKTYVWPLLLRKSDIVDLTNFLSEYMLC